MMSLGEMKRQKTKIQRDRQWFDRHYCCCGVAVRECQGECVLPNGVALRGWHLGSEILK